MNVNRIVNELRAERERIDHAIAALQSINSTGHRSGRQTAVSTPGRKRRRMSAAARKRISQARKKWWAEQKKKPAKAA